VSGSPISKGLRMVKVASVLSKQNAALTQGVFFQMATGALMCGWHW
jgi:hypothetical protein